MTLATGIGSHPGADAAAYTEAVRVVLGELAGHVGHVPELPGRGATASLTGRGVAVLTGLAADLQPAGWRLTGTGTAGLDQRRARSLLAQDLDTVEELAQGWTGPFKTQVAGPWTLAATVERPRGDKLLADHGARRELAQALAEGVRDHVTDLRRRVPAASRLVLQVDEPALGAVLDARVPTASGYGRHRAVDRPELTEALGGVLAAAVEAGAEPWVHSCAADTPWDLLRTAGARGVLADLSALTAAGHDVLAEALEAGETVALGVVPALDSEIGDADLVPRVLRWLDMLGLDPEQVGDRLLVSPACGLAGASAGWPPRALRLATGVARAVGR